MLMSGIILSVFLLMEPGSLSEAPNSVIRLALLADLLWEPLCAPLEAGRTSEPPHLQHFTRWVWRIRTPTPGLYGKH